MARTNRERACVLILEPSLPHNVFAYNTFLLRFILPLPCHDSLSLSLSLRPHLFSLRLRARLPVIIIIRSRLSRAAYSQSHDLSSCHFPLCRLRPRLSIERYLAIDYISLFLSSATPALPSIYLGVLYPRDF